MTYTQQNLVQDIGKVLVFCGIETIEYTLAQFDNIALWCRHNGIDSVLVKCGDGGNTWYNNLENVAAIRNTFIKEGVGFIPYTFLYGDKYKAYDKELAIASTLLEKYGFLCLDMEDGFNDRPDLAQTLASHFKGHNGVLLCTTWSDPQLQNWSDVLADIKPVITAFIPQVYTNYLYTTMGQLGNVLMSPAVYVGSDMPDNNPGTIAHNLAGKYQTITLWYDVPAMANTTLVTDIVNTYKHQVPPPVKLPTPQPSGGKNYMAQQFADVYAANSLGLKPTTGIASLIENAFNAKKISACYPISKEISTVDINGNAIKLQYFSNGISVQWNTKNGGGHLYDLHNQVIA